MTPDQADALTVLAAFSLYCALWWAASVLGWRWFE